MSSFVFLLLIGLAAAATVPDATMKSIKVYSMKKAPISNVPYWSEAPFAGEQAWSYNTPWNPAKPYLRAVGDAPALYDAYTPYATYAPYSTTMGGVANPNYATFSPPGPPAIPAAYAPYGAPVVPYSPNAPLARSAPLSDLSEKPVVVLIPGEESVLEARFCMDGLACLTDVAIAGRSALLFHPSTVDARSMQELGIPDLTLTRLVLPEGAKISALARANYLLLSDKNAATFSGAPFKDIGDIEVAGSEVRVLNSSPYKNSAYEEAVIKDIASKIAKKDVQ